jgi:HicB_like antitoxin of bacterial toxin-antitoxin system
MKYYYAHFRKTRNAIEVEFPDLKGCVTFADTWEDAIGNAADVLAGWMANADVQFVREPSTYDALQKKYAKGELVPIPIDPLIMKSYEELKRFNVIFPASLLTRVDQYRKEKGLKRSTLIRKATEAYLLKGTE